MYCIECFKRDGIEIEVRKKEIIKNSNDLEKIRYICTECSKTYYLQDIALDEINIDFVKVSEIELSKVFKRHIKTFEKFFYNYIASKSNKKRKDYKNEKDLIICLLKQRGIDNESIFEFFNRKYSLRTIQSTVKKIKKDRKKSNKSFCNSPYYGNITINGRKPTEPIQFKIHQDMFSTFYEMKTPKEFLKFDFKSFYNPLSYEHGNNRSKLQKLLTLVVLKVSVKYSKDRRPLSIKNKTPLRNIIKQPLSPRGDNEP